MAKRPPEDIPGDAVASARQVTEFWYNVGILMNAIDKYRDATHHDAPQLTGLVIKCDPADEQGVLVIAKGYTEDAYVVSFHRDETVVAAVTGMAKRLQNQTAKWKEDEYASGTRE